MPLLREVESVLQAIAPLAYAESWDNVGLLVGDRSQTVTRALLAIDYTPAVAAEAIEKRCELVVSYHPPIFDGLKRITADAPTDLLHRAIRHGVAIYSPHTALDVADGGTNDVLADLIELKDRRPLRLRDARPTHHKLVTFVPAASVDSVANALFDAGAGVIGNYTRCSFQSPGTGTFEAGEGSSPTIGEVNKFERVDEVRIEVLVEIGKTMQAVSALRKAHPYEEVAFDLQMLTSPAPEHGIGRIGRLPGDVTLEMLCNLVKRGLGVDRLLVVGESDAMIKRVAVCAGAGGDLLKDALSQKVDLYFTGELRHHDALRAARAGMAIVCALHSNSERVTLKRLADRLQEAANIEAFVSEADRDPFRIV